MDYLIVCIFSMIVFVSFMAAMLWRDRQNNSKKIPPKIKEMLARIRAKSQNNFRQPLVVKYFQRDDTDLMGNGTVQCWYYVGEKGGRTKFFGFLPADRWLFLISPWSPRNGKIECAVTDPALVDIVEEEVQRFANAVGAKEVEIIKYYNFEWAQAE